MYPPLRFLRPSSVAPSGVRLPSNEQRTPGQGTQGLQPTAPEYSGVSRSRRVLLVPRSGRVNCSLLTLLLTTGVSSFPGLAKLGSLGGCNPRPGRSVVRSTLSVTSLRTIALPGLFTTGGAAGLARSLGSAAPRSMIFGMGLLYCW